MPICKGARLKIKRANKHIADLETCIDGLRKRLVVSTHVDPNTGYESIKCDFASGGDVVALKDDLSVILGDAVHNLKCALDYVWQETVARLIPDRSWERIKFPCYPTSDALERKLTELEIDIAAPIFSHFLVSNIKSYRGGDWTIWAMHELDIRDKHRLLIPAIQYSSISDIYLEDEHGGIHLADTWSSPVLPYFVNFDGSLHVKDPGRASLAVMFEKGNSGEFTAAPNTGLLLRPDTQKATLQVAPECCLHSLRFLEVEPPDYNSNYLDNALRNGLSSCRHRFVAGLGRLLGG